MNTTVLALQEEQVLVAVGKSGAQPSVQALYSAPAHGGGMENWEKAIGALWQQHRLPTRGITLVLPDEAVATKTITAPSMPENKLEELVRHEMRPREDQLVAADYVPLGTDAEGRQQLFCAAWKTLPLPWQDGSSSCMPCSPCRARPVSGCALRAAACFRCWSRTASTVIPAAAVFSVSRARWISAPR